MICLKDLLEITPKEIILWEHMILILALSHKKKKKIAQGTQNTAKHMEIF